jgi:hypothetical protein
MRIILINIFFSGFLFTACAPNEESVTIPSDVLSEEQFIKVLTDCYLAEGAAGINVKNVTGQKFDSAYIFNPLKDNQISKPLFDSSISFYTKHPKLLKTIYEKILDRLSQIQANGKIDTVDSVTVNK